MVAAKRGMMCLFFLMGLVSIAGASANPGDQSGQFIRFRGLEFDPLADGSRPGLTAAAQAYAASVGGDDRVAPGPSSPGPAAESVFVAQHDGKIPAGWADALRSMGAVVLGYVPDHAFLIRATPEGARRIAALPGTRWTGPVPREMRIDPGVREMAWRPTGAVERGAVDVDLVVATYRGSGVDALLGALESEGLAGTVRVFREGPSGRGYAFITVEAHRLAGVLDVLENEPSVARVESYPGAVLFNDQAACIGQSGHASPCNPGTAVDAPVWAHGILGQGQVLGIIDTGLDTDACQFRNGPADQTLAVSVTPPNTIAPAMTSKVIAYYVVPGGEAYDHTEFVTHGTHTTGCAVGDNYAQPAGTMPPYGHDTGDGMAPAAKVVVQDVSQPLNILGGLAEGFTDLFQQAYDTGARVHNNSYGAAYRGDPAFLDTDFGYSIFSAQIDEVQWRLRDFTVVFAAGNWGLTDTDRDSAADGRRTIAGMGAVAKNTVTVGAAGNPSNPSSGFNQFDVYDHSSHGPTREGLLKPDVVAPGDNLTALGDATTDPPDNTCGTDRINLATYKVGTSLASATTAGYGLLIRQYFADAAKYYKPVFNMSMTEFSPSNALVKAMLINAGRDLLAGGAGKNSGLSLGATSPIPAGGQGWGRVTLDDVLYFPGDARRVYLFTDTFNGAVVGDRTRGEQYRKALEDEETHNFGFQVTSGALQDLKISLAWSDPEGEPGAGVLLVNDLDVVLVAPGGVTFHGNQFKPTGPYSEEDPAVFDRANATESIFLLASTQLPPGPYSLRVTGFNVPGNGAEGVAAKPTAPGNNSIDSDRQGYALVMTAEDGVRIVDPPQVGATVAPSIVCTPPGTVAFTSQCTNCAGAITYAWEFGAAAVPPTSAAQNPSVSFPTPGLYKTQLTVTDQITGISAVLQFPLRVIVGTTAMPASAGHTLLMRKLSSATQVEFYWIDVGAPAISSYQIWSFTSKLDLPTTPPKVPPPGTAVLVRDTIQDGEAGALIRQTVNLAPTPNLIYYQVRGKNCDGSLVGPP